MTSYEIITKHDYKHVVRFANGKIGSIYFDKNGVLTGGFVSNAGPGGYRITPDRFKKLWKELEENYK